MNRNLLIRIATAVVAVPLLILFLELGGLFVSVGLLVAAALAAYEYFAVVAKDDRLTQAVGVAAAASLAAISTWGPLMPVRSEARMSSATLLLVMVVLMCVAAFFLVRSGEMTTAWPRLAMLVGGALYTGLPLSFLARLREIPEEGRLWCYLPMVLTWGNDTFAYFCGRAFGKHKLAPAISPGKTWEGAMGAAFLTVGAAFVWRAVAMPSLTVADCVGLGLGISLLGPIGDLTESVWKRSAGIKDSGTMIPGHGGLLDRIDALMFTAPYLYFFAEFLHPWRPF
ncbi:MAG: phosphatidate cytidylyltransferase [Myxococcota bacterium]